jgi:hypothetical protein
MFALLQQSHLASAPLPAPSGDKVVKIAPDKLRPKTYDEIRQRVEEERGKARKK